MKKKTNLYCVTVLCILIISACSKEKVKYTKMPYPLLGDGIGLEKVTFLVKDLKKTRNYFADTLGFDMSKEDTFSKGQFEGTLTTGIYFPDLTSIEFFALQDSLITKNTPSFIADFLAKSEGIQKYSISSSSVDSTYSWLTKQGFQLDSIKSYRTQATTRKGWSGDNGGSQEKSIDFKNANKGYFPTFLQGIDSDYKQMNQMWKTYYGYGRSFSKHPNGVVGMIGFQIAVDSLDVARDQFQNMGFAEIEDTSAKNSVRFKVKRHQELELKSPLSSDDEIAKFLKKRGSGVFSIRFEVKNMDSTYHYFKERLPKKAFLRDSLKRKLTIFREYAQGVQLEFISEPKEQALMAQKLRIGDKLDSVASKNAANLYQKYCALCHAENREGYAADNAPSLRSHSLLGTSKNSNFMRYTIQFGRANTAMAGYLDTQGGPMEYIEIELLLQWLYEQSGVEKEIEISREPVKGDITLGAKVYENNCAVCHGSKGEGISAPALGNPMLLATATDEFLKYAITEGRDGTPMAAFKNVLSKKEINGVTAFLRSRASGWNVPKTTPVKVPKPEEYILNPKNKNPKFTLKDGLYVPAKQVFQALKDSARFVILDARSTVAWRQTHIPGAVPVPYYEEPETFINDIPKDDTWIIVYCACPHAASRRVVNTLRRYGFKKTAIIDEGVLVWAQLGYPVLHGE